VEQKNRTARDEEKDRKKLGRKTFKRMKNVREHKGNMWMSRGGK
jgi:hypothetical protein